MPPPTFLSLPSVTRFFPRLPKAQSFGLRLENIIPIYFLLFKACFFVYFHSSCLISIFCVAFRYSCLGTSLSALGGDNGLRAPNLRRLRLPSESTTSLLKRGRAKSPWSRPGKEVGRKLGIFAPDHKSQRSSNYGI